ncbi:MAG TPA: sterol desaturase family protein [Labilithrix sp.]|nr:sterol desaturase family protein [Labilithrix sp.]
MLPALIFSLALVLFAFEVYAPRWDARAQFDLDARSLRIAKNVMLAGINVVVAKGFMTVAAGAASLYALPWRPAWLTSGPQALAFDLILFDLWIYAWHRVVHAVPFTWRFHQVHHQDEIVDVTTAVRFHPGDILLSYLSRGTAAVVLAIPAYHAFLFEALTVAAAIFHHANVRLPRTAERILGLVLVTPAAHHVHHHPSRTIHDSNYGTIFSIWDRLFGTRVEGPSSEFTPGLDGRPDEGMLGLLVTPLRSGKRTARP